MCLSDNELEHGLALAEAHCREFADVGGHNKAFRLCIRKVPDDASQANLAECRPIIREGRHQRQEPTCQFYHANLVIGLNLLEA